MRGPEGAGVLEPCCPSTLHLSSSPQGNRESIWGLLNYVRLTCTRTVWASHTSMAVPPGKAATA